MEKASYFFELEEVIEGEMPSAPLMVEEEEAQENIERPVFPNPHKDFEYNEIVKPIITKSYQEPRHHCQSVPIQPTTIIIQTSPSQCCKPKKCKQEKTKKINKYLPYIAGIIISIGLLGFLITYFI